MNNNSWGDVHVEPNVVVVKINNDSWGHIKDRTNWL